MKTIFRKVVLCGLLGVAVLAIQPTPAKADPDDRYWRNHWGWYDGTYRPYYHRRYYYAPPSTYVYPPAPYYGGTTYYNYGPAPAYPYYGGGVVVGPLRFGWW